jgi:HEPN domain-containing protein
MAKSRTRKDFQRLAEIRAKEAHALMRSRNQQGAYYLAGFAVECAIKASIARKTKRYDFPVDPGASKDIYSHDLTKLLKIAELDSQLDKDIRTNPDLATSWGLIKTWRVECRYETSGLNGKDMVNSLNGVMEWIKHYW